MVRKLTSLPVVVTLAIGVPLLAVLMGAVLRLGVPTIAAVVGPLGVALIVATVTRSRRTTAWLRGKVPWEYRNAPTTWALITEAEGTPERLNDQPVMRFRMRVFAPEGEFDSVMYALLPVYPANQFETGAHYPVRYLPNDHSEVVYDTTSAAQHLGPRPGWGTGRDPSMPSGDEPNPASFTNYPSAAASPSSLLASIPGIDPSAMMAQIFPDRLPGTALVKAQRATGQNRGPLAETEFDLTITPENGAPFDTTVTKWLPTELAAQVPAGSTVAVYYSPTSPSEVSIQLTPVTHTDIFN
ncbi:MAG: hypothetical protein LWW77_05575 [Propionibacteriales bacterium]|nr:hypothetical protein [Propionibacteriales bacterium]